MNTNRCKMQGARCKIILFALLALFLMMPGIAQAGKVLPDDLLITNDAAGFPHDQTSPAVAYDCDHSDNENHYLVVWTDYRNIGTPSCGTDIYGKICTGAGSGLATSMTCGAEFVISNATGNQAQPKVAFSCKNKTYLVVWTDSRSGSYGQIYGQLVSPAGALLNTASDVNFPISTITTVIGVANIDFSAAAKTITKATGGFLAADFSAGNKIAITGSASNNGTFTLTSVTDTVLTVAEILIDEPASSPTISSAGLAYVNQYDPDVIDNPVANKFVVAWVDTSTFDTDANAQNSKTFTGFNAISGQSCINSYTYSYISVPYADHNLIRTIEVDAITGALTNKQEISQFAILSPLTDIGAVILGSSVTGSWSVYKNEAKPKLSYNSMTGETLVAFSGRNYTVTLNEAYTNGLVCSVTTSTSCTSSTDCPTGETCSKLHCIYNPATFTATDNDAGVTQIKIRKNDGLGLLQDMSLGFFYQAGPPIVKLSAIAPTVAMDPNTNRMFVAWEESTSVTTSTTTSSYVHQIYGQLIDLDSFLPYCPHVIQISVGTGERTSPVTAFDNVNQRFFVAWEDARNQSANISNMDIYGQFIDPQCNLSGANSLVSMAVDNQLAPAMAFGDVNFRDFFVVFKDARNPGNSDIYGQLFQWSEMPQLLITDSAGAPILNGAIDFGNIAVGLTKDINFKLCNNGNTQLTINSMTMPSDPFSSLTPPPVTISPRICYDMIVHFAPTAAGSYSGNRSNNFSTTIDSDGGKVIIYFSGAGSGINQLNITTASLPDGSASSAYTASLTGVGGVFPYTWSLSSGSLPPGLSLNASTGVISGVIAAGTSGIYNFTVTATDSNSPTKTSTISNLSINVTGMNITTTSFKTWTIGVRYENTPVQYITVSGGTAPYTCAKTSGTLPNGITVNATCSVTGVPSESGVFTFTVAATDSSGTTATKDLSVTINPLPVILTSSLPSGVVGIIYSQTLLSSGGTSPLKWSISKGATTTGALPPGLSFNTGSGVISGTPTAPGTYSFNAQVTDATGQASVTMPLSISAATSGAGGGTTSTLSASPASIDFGTVSPGSKSAVQTVTISNNSGASQTITTLTKPGAPFNVPSSTCSSGSILANGASCVINIVFNPTARGKFSKNITLTNPNLSVPLTGTGG